MAVDLHIHTTASDGRLSPSEVVREACRIGLTAIAIADHDTVAGVEEAISAASQQCGLKVIPALELSTDVEDSEVHILGYFVDIKNSRLLDQLAELRRARIDRAKRILDKLRRVGVDIPFEDVASLGKDGFVGRGQIFRAMINAGYVNPAMPHHAFEHYLGKHGVAYEEHYGLTPYDAVDMVLNAGGIPVIAHPARTASDRLVGDLVRHGLMGIEAYYPGYTAEITSHYLDLARTYDLVVTGGSDFHGPTAHQPVGIGGVWVPDDIINNLYLRMKE
ncbi:MAG TPA: PHP domain-containing protein [Firmicutes bacterium]|nr:PHP domain-containing protein [Bacillota bacterium]